MDTNGATTAMRDTMGHLQFPTEPPTLLHQARDFLVEARRLKPGPERNEMRETAKVLRELAKLEASNGGNETFRVDDRW